MKLGEKWMVYLKLHEDWDIVYAVLQKWINNITLVSELLWILDYLQYVFLILEEVLNLFYPLYIFIVPFDRSFEEKSYAVYYPLVLKNIFSSHVIYVHEASDIFSINNLSLHHLSIILFTYLVSYRNIKISYIFK